MKDRATSEMHLNSQPLDECFILTSVISKAHSWHSRSISSKNNTCQYIFNNRDGWAAFDGFTDVVNLLLLTLYRPLLLNVT